MSRMEIYQTKCDMTDPVGSGCVSSVEDVEVVVTIHVESLKFQQELLEDGLCLEGNDAVLIPLVPALQHHPVHRPLDLGEEVSLPGLVANLVHLI